MPQALPRKNHSFSKEKLIIKLLFQLQKGLMVGELKQNPHLFPEDWRFPRPTNNKAVVFEDLQNHRKSGATSCLYPLVCYLHSSRHEPHDCSKNLDLLNGERKKNKQIKQKQI